MEILKKINELLLNAKYNKSKELLADLTASINNLDLERKCINEYIKKHLTKLNCDFILIMYLLENEEDELVYLNHFNKYVIPLLIKDNI